MEEKYRNNNKTSIYGSSLLKTNSASSLSLVSNPNSKFTLRNDNENYGLISNSFNSDTNKSKNSSNFNSRHKNLTESLDFDSDIDLDSNLGSGLLPKNNSGITEERSSIKSTFINVFSLKNKSALSSSSSSSSSTSIPSILKKSKNVNTRIRNVDISFQKGKTDSTISTLSTIESLSTTTISINSSDSFCNNSLDISSLQKLEQKSKNINNPNIFKKIVSRKALIPRMKAFKRISDDMQIESYPLHDEMRHELMITTAMKEEVENLNSESCCSSLLTRKNNSQFLLNYDNLKKFEIINKANESWNNNRRKSSSSLTNSESFKSLSRHGSLTNINIHSHSNLNKRRSSISSLTPTNTTNSISNTIQNDNDKNNKNDKISKLRKSSSHLKLSNPFASIKISRKRKMGNYDDVSTDLEENFSDDGGLSSWNPIVNCKRRLVSSSLTNSPKSPALDAFPSRRNSIMMIHTVQSASDDFESMSLK